MLFTIHVVALTIITEVIIACFYCFPFGKIIVVFALAEEALWLAVAVVAHTNITITIGALTIEELCEIIRIWFRRKLWK